MVLISDGKETCGRDPVQIAGEINKSDVEIITNVVGFGVGGSAEQQLKDLATQGKGEYYAAHSSGELNLALAKMSQQNICSTKETMAKMESLFSVNTTNTKCLFRINTELQSVQVGINMLGITKEKDEKTGITTDCKKYVMGKYKERAESIRAQIEDIHTESMEKINSQQ